MSNVMMAVQHSLTRRSIPSSDIGREAGHPVDLYCPGKLLHLQRKGVEGLPREAQQFVLVEGKAVAQFKFIALRNTFLTDHRPVNILMALESLASRPVEG
jgi:hypothetical protein